MHSRKMRNLAISNESLKKELQEARSRLQQRKQSGVRHSAWMALTTEHPREEEETWFATYLDMMTLLLVLMLVMLAFAGAQDAGHEHNDKDAVFNSDNAQVSTTKGELLGTLVLSENAFIWRGFDFSALRNDIDVLVSDDSVKLRVNSELLFPSAKSDLSLAGLSILKKLLPIFKQNDVYITVEGHTDNVPIRNHRYPSNWELSGARAGSVVRYLESNGTASERLRAVGYADVQPISDNNTRQGRALNRRVEFEISHRPFPESVQFEQ